MTAQHVAVLRDEVVAALAVEPSGTYVDATYGRGGHSVAILGRLGSNGRLLIIDRDPEAIQVARNRHAGDARVIIEHGVFSQVGLLAAQHGIDGEIQGALFDLGVSSPQLAKAERGFSFLKDGPLDMRMDCDHGLRAADWLARVDVDELARVLKEYGEERRARAVARAIVAARERKPICSTVELAKIVSTVIRARPGAIHPATRSFQAIRIFINDELNELSRALTGVVQTLRVGGHLVVISFHSLEDRIVKRFFRHESEVTAAYRGLPQVPEDYQPRLALLGKAVTASASEIALNPRARSARLRAAQRIR